MPLTPPSPFWLAPVERSCLLKIERPRYVKLAKKDYYSSLEQLKSDLAEGSDYLINHFDRGSQVTIVSPHGGGIEAGTSELARAIAGKRYNLYDFFAKSYIARVRGHVTSTHFRDPKLLSLLKKSRICVSIHRMKDRHSTLYLGGSNSTLKNAVADELDKRGFLYTTDPPRLKGTSKRNFVNMVQDKGLQIEIPKTLANQLITNIDSIYTGKADYQPRCSDSQRFLEFVDSVRSGIESYLTKQL